VRDVLNELMAWWHAGDAVGVGTVVATFRSAPRPAGASMLVGPGGEAVGSVSGGCVEGAVYELGQEVMASGTPVLQRYGVSDDDAFSVGLTCGGILDVFVETVSKETFPELGSVAADVEAGRPVAVATVIDHPDPAFVGRRLVVRPEGAAGEVAGEGRAGEAGSDAGGTASAVVAGSLGSERADAAVTDDVRGLLAAGRTETLTYGPDGERRGEGMRVFVASYAPRPRMLVFGAIDFAAAVAHVGAFLGYRVTVCDARPVFATASTVPGRRRGGRRLAAPLPGRRGRRGADRPAHGDLRAHPRPEVRRAGARGGVAAARGGVRRGHGVAAHPRGPAGPAARGRG
jgi:xanthine dehydrogenase accessory factor